MNYFVSVEYNFAYPKESFDVIVLPCIRTLQVFSFFCFDNMGLDRHMTQKLRNFSRIHKILLRTSRWDVYSENALCMPF